MFKHFYRLMVVALGVFLASSCGKSTPLYGCIEGDFDELPVTDNDVCPFTEYRIEGTILSTMGTPIEGIKITPSNNSIGVAGIDGYYAEIYSGPTGNFSFAAWDECGNPKTTSFVIIADDVDGDQNGNFATKETAVSLECNDVISSDNHCANTAVKIELEEVSSDDDTLVNE